MALLDRMADERVFRRQVEAVDHEKAVEDEFAGDEEGPPEMELQTFEHYDYVVFVFRNTHDWRAAIDKLGLGQSAFTLRDGVKRKVGFGRVVDGVRLLGLLPKE